VRVAGPFTVESLRPTACLAVDVDDSLFDELEAAEGRRQKDAVGGGEAADFVAMVLDNLRRSGVQQAHKADRLVFSSIAVWPGRFLVRKGRRGNRLTGRTCPSAAWRSSWAPNMAPSAALT
jgi:adenine-specific DNA-methyltransferase